MYVRRSTETLPLSRSCRRNAVTITHSEWLFVALFIQYAMRMQRITFLYVACAEFVVICVVLVVICIL
jgi:hypothetical protein